MTNTGGEETFASMAALRWLMRKMCLLTWIVKYFVLVSNYSECNDLISWNLYFSQRLLEGIMTWFYEIFLWVSNYPYNCWPEFKKSQSESPDVSKLMTWIREIAIRVTNYNSRTNLDKTLFIKRDAYTLHRCKHPYNNHPYNNSTYFSVSSAFFSHLSTKASA